MFTDAIEIAVAAVGLGLLALSIRQGRAKGWAASLQMAAGGFLLMGAAAVGIVGFVVGLVFSPLAWIGVGMLAFAGVLFATGQKLEAPSGTKASEQGSVESSGSAKGEVASGRQGKSSGSTGDSELDDIEAILRKHGIE